MMSSCKTCETETEGRRATAATARVDSSNQTMEYLSRARRFPIRTGISFRKRGENEWHEGQSVNISRTGILFRAEHDLVPQTHLEMCVDFPKEITGSSPISAMFWGLVIRTEPTSSIDGPPAKAAAILRYHLSSQ